MHDVRPNPQPQSSLEAEELKHFAPQTAVDETTPVSNNGPVLKPNNLLQEQKVTPMKSRTVLPVILLVAVIGGIATGYGVHKLTAKKYTTSVGSGNAEVLQQVAGEAIQVGDVFGSPDESTFKDSAEGYLAAGGVEGEGSHRLLRPGGESQTVSLTSSITDMSKFEGMEVKVWGETFSGQKAGWLMDVGRVEVVKIKGQEPTE